MYIRKDKPLAYSLQIKPSTSSTSSTDNLHFIPVSSRYIKQRLITNLLTDSIQQHNHRTFITIQDAFHPSFHPRDLLPRPICPMRPETEPLQRSRRQRPHQLLDPRRPKMRRCMGRECRRRGPRYPTMGYQRQQCQCLGPGQIRSRAHRPRLCPIGHQE